MRFTRQSASSILEAIRSARYPLPDHQRKSRIFRHVTTLGSMTFVIGLTCAISGCSQSPGFPVAPSSTGTTTPPIGRPNVTAVIPAVGSAAGGSIVKIVGTGFMPGMIVTFDDIKVTQVDYPTSSFTTFYTETPAHPVGTADLIVTNPDGQSQRVAAAYTYGLEDAFDMNGVWAGFTINGTDTAVGFEIRGNTLVSAVCAYTAAVPFIFSTLPRVQNGGFSLIADDGATLSGKIVSASEIVGTINFPACNNTRLTWRVNRKND
jgi:IPT/TIG domain-containing protein